MDTSDLLAQLQQRIGDASRDHARLSEAVAALEAEITRLEGDAAVISRLRTLFEPQHDASAAPMAAAAAATNTAKTSIAWPTTRDASPAEKPKGLRSWARAKLESAAWYIETLQKIESDDVGSAASLGVEMAVDGAVSSLCAAFEAMICSLTRAIERVADIPKDSRTPLHLASWSKLAAASKVFDIDLASNRAVSNALVGEHSDEPAGWMAQLLVLRRELALHDLISNGGHANAGRLLLDVPKRGEVPLVGYLIATFESTDELLEAIEQDIDDAKSGRMHIAAVDELRERAEQGIEDLLPPGAFNTP